MYINNMGIVVNRPYYNGCLITKFEDACIFKDSRKTKFRQNLQ